MKAKTCRYCKQKFIPERPKAICCSPDCAYDYGLKVKSRAEHTQSLQDRKTIRILKEGIKTKSEWAREAQTAFNQFIRARDEKEPCISCGRFHEGQYHAGHYRTVGAHPELRFNELNVHKQCSVCNNHKHGNIVEYRINLARKIGLEKLDWLEGNHSQAKYTEDDYKRIKAEYKLKLKELNK
jgi:hypothetical protein